MADFDASIDSIAFQAVMQNPLSLAQRLSGASENWSIADLGIPGSGTVREAKVIGGATDVADSGCVSQDNTALGSRLGDKLDNPAEMPVTTRTSSDHLFEADDDKPAVVSCRDVGHLDRPTAREIVENLPDRHQHRGHRRVFSGSNPSSLKLPLVASPRSLQNEAAASAEGQEEGCSSGDELESHRGKAAMKSEAGSDRSDILSKLSEIGAAIAQLANRQGQMEQELSHLKRDVNSELETIKASRHGAWSESGRERLRSLPTAPPPLPPVTSIPVATTHTTSVTSTGLRPSVTVDQVVRQFVRSSSRLPAVARLSKADAFLTEVHAADDAKEYPCLPTSREQALELLQPGAIGSCMHAYRG